MRLMRLLVVAFVATLPACSAATGPGPGFVTVDDNIFTPVTVHPASDGLVTWTWNGMNAHNVIFDDGIGNASARTNGFHTRGFTGAAAGTYPYQCTLHSGMVGQVVVP